MKNGPLGPFFYVVAEAEENRQTHSHVKTKMNYTFTAKIKIQLSGLLKIILCDPASEPEV